MRVIYKSLCLCLLCLCVYIPVQLHAEEPVYVVKSTKTVKPDPAFVKLLSEAKAAQKKANSVGGEWRDVGKFIKDAEKAAQKGDLSKANKLAKKAKSQSEMGYRQAVRQKGGVVLPSSLK